MQIAIPGCSPGTVQGARAASGPCHAGGARIGGVRHEARRGSGIPLRRME
jgi:hypothetical protein